MKNYLFSLVTGIAILIGSCSGNSETSDSKPVDNSGKDTVFGGKVKVMSYNIHHCNPPSKTDYIDINAIVNVIRAEKPDLCALQEVDVKTSRSGDFNQAEEIANKLGMHYFFGKAIDYQGGEYGVAILSKYAMSEPIVHRLPTKVGTNGELRVLATAKVTLPDGTVLRFGSTHLDSQSDATNRQLQIDEIGVIASSEQLPFIIAGDFNATPGSGIINTLDQNFTRTCQSCSPTIPVVNPTKAIDFIAFKDPKNEFSVVSHKVINEQYASDHRPVVAVINLK